MKPTYLVLLLGLSACADDTLRRVCGNIKTQCYAVWTDYYQDPNVSSPRQAELLLELAEEGLVGECQLGRPTCDVDGNIIDCEGAIYPTDDVCDGLDNNCNGEVDDGYYSRTSGTGYSNADDVCISNHGVCRSATAVCRDGRLECNYPDTFEPGDETSCDGRDNDCDGRIDEEIGNEELCYDGEFWTATNGDCRPGVMRCVQGHMMCDGQKLPSPELCDQIDNDCNGITDDTGETLSSQHDIVFIIDTSGSMCPYIAAVAAALDAYVEQFEDNEDFRFAIVIMSTYGDDLATVDTDFTDLSTIRTRLLQLGCNGSSAEASLDSMQQVCDEGNPLSLSWEEDAIRLFFMFTDEGPQTYTDPDTTWPMVVDACIQSSTLPFIWGPWADQEFERITDAANGRWFPISNYWEQMFEDLNSIIITLCGDSNVP